jgi:hypothetical protein
MSDLLDTLVQALQAQAARNRGFLSDAMARSLAAAAIETIRQHQRGSVTSAEEHKFEEGQEIWEPTGELRWFTEHTDRPVKLQQAFRSVHERRVDWREVPLVVAQKDL